MPLIKVNITQKKKNENNVKPLETKKKNLTLMQKRLLKEHSKFHSKKHIDYMRKLMLKGYCLQQAHKLAIKNIGK